MMYRPSAGGQGNNSRMKHQHQGNSTSRMVVANKPQYKNNNLMVNSTQKSMHGEGSEHISGDQAMNRHARSKPMIENEQRLADIANSVSGFYKDTNGGQHTVGAMSEHGGSNLSRTQDHFASNLANNRRQPQNLLDPNNISPRDDPNQEHYQRVYGTENRGQGRSRGGIGINHEDISGDEAAWERQSHRSGRSQAS